MQIPQETLLPKYVRNWSLVVTAGRKPVLPGNHSGRKEIPD